MDEVCTDMTEKMKSQLDGKIVTLVEDGWSNIHNEPVVATCLTVNGKSYFLDAHDIAEDC